MSIRLLACIAILALLPGCAALSSYKQERQQLMNPQRINESADPASRAFAAQEVQVNAYYKAMAQAQTNYDANPAVLAPAAAIANYVDEGIALNTAFCRRWFHRIDDTQRQVQWGSRDMNIITALGTTALGVLEAGARTVSVYGAATSALAAFGENFNSALLTAPGAKNVESKVMAMLGSYGAQLKADAPGLRFAEAYTRLETHADICTFSSIRDVVNSSLTQTEASVSASGTISTAAVSSSFVKDDSGERIIAWWIPGNVIDLAHQALLLDWMAAHGVNVSIAFLAHSKLYEAARKQAVADLAVPAVAK